MVDQYQDQNIDTAQLEETESYRSLMLKWYRDLKETHAAFDVAILSGRGDDNLLNIYIAQLCDIGRELLPKVRTGGSTLKDLLPQYKEFEKWFENTSVVKSGSKELDKIPKLYSLIITTYDLMGITTLN